MTPRCPYCRQIMGAMRFGVLLPSFKAALLDRIRAAGDIGVSSEQLISSELYRDRRAVQVTTIKAHVNQLNDLLSSTDWCVASDRRRWFPSRRRQ
jgi:hypothetical protein